ncbi:MAG: hypothetical protein HC801_00430 [Nitrospira sp.]|nr:hypothetical protein [Nitrospira sp.]
MFNAVGKVIRHTRHKQLRLTAAAQQARLALARSNILALRPSSPDTKVIDYT